MVARLFLVSAVAFLITVVGHYYIYLRMIEPLADVLQVPFVTILTVLWGLTFFGFPLARAVPVSLRKFVEFPMYVWMGVAYVVLLLCFLSSPFHLFLLGMNLRYENQILAYILWTLTALVSLFGLLTAVKKERVIEAVIPVKLTLPQAVEELRIVVLSDVHVAGLVGRRRMKRVARIVNEAKPHFVFVTGDLVDGSVSQLKREVMPLSEMKPEFGVYYVTGNHEYYCNAPKWKRFLAEKLGWNVLQNQALKVDALGVSLNILGIEDRSWLHYSRKLGETGDVRLENAAGEVDVGSISSSLNILLAHQPKDARLLQGFPWIDLQVSGHTHGGQLWPLFLLVERDQTFNRGLHKLANPSQHIYVTQGTTFWGPPMRLGTECEITLLRFRRS